MGQLHGRAGRAGRTLLVRAACALVVLAAPAAFPMASASFSGSTADDGNSVTSADVAPPANFAVSQTCAAAPAPVFRGASSATGTTTLTLSVPVQTVAGDLLLAQVMNRNLGTLTPPAGWTLIRRDTSSAEVQSALYWKVAAVGEPNPTFTLSASMQMAGGIAAYAGVHATSPVDAHGAVTGASATATAPSVTTTQSNTMLVHALAKRQEALAAPAGTSSRWSVQSGGSAGSGGVTAGDAPFPGPGPTTARTSTSVAAFSSEWIGQTVALRPVAGTPSVAATWTASPSTSATGYRLERSVGGTVQATSTVIPISATATTDGPLVNGTAYSYRLWAYLGTWTSVAVTAGLTPSC
jgi:hypothetical protein